MTANEQRAKDGKPPYLYWPFNTACPTYFMVLAGNESWLKASGRRLPLPAGDGRL